MSMLSQQIKELREGAKVYDHMIPPRTATLLREAADTIESLRESYGKVPEQGKGENEGERESYDAGFSNGVKACLQQLDGLIHDGADVEEIQGWIDSQWEEL